MKTGLINPRWVFAKNDYIGSGIPYWPTSLAAFNWLAKKNGIETLVLDFPALDIESVSVKDDVVLQGMDLKDFNRDTLESCDNFVVYALNYAGITELQRTIIQLSKDFGKPIYLLENTQAVTGFQFNHEIRIELMECGVQEFLAGDPVNAFNTFLKSQKLIETNYINLSEVSLEWERYQVDSYNSLPYSHGPKRSKFIPLMTSWGCPYGCDFCVIPRTTSRKWIPKKPGIILEEIENAIEKYGVSDFQIEDLNPTVKWSRWQEICELIIERNLQITYSIVSGTKSETIPLDQVTLLKKSGCRYLSISPESGSPKLMKRIGKHFNHSYALRLVNKLNKSGIRTQACFLVGHPKETLIDKLQTAIYMIKLLARGVSEVAIFVVAPHPGSDVANKITRKNSPISTFSGHGRRLSTLDRLQKIVLIGIFAFHYLFFPKKIFLTVKGLFFKPAETKIENTARRALFIRKRLAVSR